MLSFLARPAPRGRPAAEEPVLPFSPVHPTAVLNPVRRRAVGAFGALATLLAVPGAARATLDDAFEPQLGRRGKDVMWLPTPDGVIDRLMHMAGATPQDRLVDLGAGDGRIVIAAARDFGVRGRGIEYDPAMVEFARQQAESAGVASLVSFEQGDIFETDFSDATIVSLYLLPELNLRLRPLLMAMRPGTRVVAHQFDMGRWTPDETSTVSHRAGYLWVIPANVTGDWKLRYGEGTDAVKATLAFEQRFQRVAGTAAHEAFITTLRQPRLLGDRLRFALTDPSGVVREFDARVGAKTMRGDAQGADGTRVPFFAERVGDAPSLDGAQAPSDEEMHAAVAALGGQ